MPRGPLWAELPLLLALLLAPHAGGYQDPFEPLLLGGAVWLAFLLRLLAPGQPPLHVPRGVWLPAAFVAVAAASFVSSGNRGATLIQLSLYAAYAGLALLAADAVARDRQQPQGAALRMLVAFLAGAFVVGALGVQEYLVQLRLGNQTWRAFTRFTNPNFYAGFLAPALLLALGVSLQRPEAFQLPARWRFAMGLLIATLAAALMVTGSRGGLLTFGAGLAVFLVVAAARGRLRDREARTTLVVLLLVMGAVAAALTGPIRARETAPPRALIPEELCPASTQPAPANSNGFRILTWQGTLNMAKARPVLGWGAGAYDTAFAPHAIAGFTRHAHSTYFQLLAEEGLLGMLAWLLLLLAGLAGLWKLAGDANTAWATGALAGLVASAAHNLLDSLVYVPAIALGAWLLIGLGLAAWGDRPARSTGTSPWALAAACAGLLLCADHALGRYLLDQGRPGGQRPTAENLRTLEAAQRLLPFDREVASAQSTVHLYLGEAHAAEEAARRATLLAPERPGSYFTLALIQRFEQNLPLALETHKLGLEAAPHDTVLLYSMALLQEQLGQPQEALRTYRRIYEVEQSPVGQVRPLSDYVDYRFARARLALAREAEGSGDREAAFEHRHVAACQLGLRRNLFELIPVTYQQEGKDLQNERELRQQEATLWKTLAEEYRKQDKNRLAVLAEDQAKAATDSMERLENVIRQIPEELGL